MLQIPSVDKGVAYEGCQGQPGTQGVYPEQQNRHSSDANGYCENKCLLRIYPPLRQRPIVSPLHQNVDLAIDQMINNSAGGGHQGYAKVSQNQDIERSHAWDSEKHAYQ